MDGVRFEFNMIYHCTSTYEKRFWLNDETNMYDDRNLILISKDRL